MMKSYVRIEVTVGTWCADSQREVPKFLRIFDDLKPHFGVEVAVSDVALDRSKQKPAELIAGKTDRQSRNVIYYRGDRELGRIEWRSIRSMAPTSSRPGLR